MLRHLEIPRPSCYIFPCLIRLVSQAVPHLNAWYANLFNGEGRINLLLLSSKLRRGRMDGLTNLPKSLAMANKKLPRLVTILVSYSPQYYCYFLGLLSLTITATTRPLYVLSILNSTSLKRIRVNVSLDLSLESFYSLFFAPVEYAKCTFCSVCPCVPL